MTRLLATSLSMALMLSVLTAAVPAAVSAATYGFFGGHRYEVIEDYLSWHDAVAYCEDRGAHLVTINSAEENAFVFGLKSDTWLGATDELVEGEWRWVTGEPFSYTNWAPGEPNDSNEGLPEHYLFFFDRPRDGHWNDIGVDNAIQFICERTAKSLQSGIRVTVRCYSNPEKVTIRNNRKRAITIVKLGSVYRPRAAEPYRVDKRLKPGKSITYSFGPRLGPHRLTRKFIFHDTADSEGAKVRIKNRGGIKKSC